MSLTHLPAETWDDDDDFDLSGLSSQALGLPHLGKNLEETAHADDFRAGANVHVIQASRESDDDDDDNGEEKDWNLDHDNNHNNDNDDDDDDNVDTLKLSDFTSETLAQLASLRKPSKPQLENQDLGSLSIDNLSGKVTNLGSFSHKSQTSHAEVGEWDNDLELPDAFPVLQSQRRGNDSLGFANDPDSETPSLGSLSDATTFDTSTSGSRDRSLTHWSATSKDGRMPRSSTSSQSSCFASRPEGAGLVFHGDDSEDSSFELSGSMTILQLNPRLLCKAQDVSLDRTTGESSTNVRSGIVHTAEVNGAHANRGPRYLNTTAASRARQTSMPHREVTSTPADHWPSRIMREPRRLRNYGNGMELDSIADLPIQQMYSPAQREADSSNWRERKPEAQVFARVRVASGSSSPADTASRGKSRKARRKEPTLIRNLGGPSAAPRVVGDMRWNPSLQRWEGNEEEGRTFEMAVPGRIKGAGARGAKLSAGSAKAILGPKRKVPERRTTSDASSTVHSMDARMVGDMVFDPIKLCWLNKNKEDEVDPFAEMNDDFEETDPSSTALAAGRMKASSVTRPRSELGRAREPEWSAAAISRVLRGRNKDSVPDALANRIPNHLWLESIAAKRRHDEQIAGFVPTNQQQQQQQQQRTPFSRGTLPHRSDRSRHLHLIRLLARRAGTD